MQHGIPLNKIKVITQIQYYLTFPFFTKEVAYIECYIFGHSFILVTDIEVCVYTRLNHYISGFCCVLFLLFTVCFMIIQHLSSLMKRNAGVGPRITNTRTLVMGKKASDVDLFISVKETLLPTFNSWVNNELNPRTKSKFERPRLTKLTSLNFDILKPH